MSNLTDKESQLCDIIKNQFKNQGVIEDINCQLQSRLVHMMRGGAENVAQSKHKAEEKDARIHLLHQLIMEYLQWHQFKYTAEMFSMESGITDSMPNRNLLETAVGDFKIKDIPILLEIVMDLWDKKPSE